MRLNEIEPSGLLGSPQLLTPSNFGYDVETINSNEAQKFLSNKKCKQVGTLMGLPLYKCGNRYALIEITNGVPHLRYYVQYENKWVTLLKHNAIQQVMVWRGKGYSNVATSIFFDYLLPETGCIITDAFQTPDGEKFWWDRVKQALEKNLFVYYLDIMPPNLVIKRLHTFNEFRNISQVAWGDSQRNQEKRIIITTFEMPEKGLEHIKA